MTAATSVVAPTVEAGLGRRARWLLAVATLMVLGSYAFLSYWEYSRFYNQYPMEWANLLAGKGKAPEQYRVGVLGLAGAIMRVTHNRVPMRWGLGFCDAVFLAIGLPAILFLITRTRTYLESRQAGRFIILLLALFLFLFYLFWMFWFHMPETIGSFLCLALSLLLVAGQPRLPRWLAVAGLVLIAACDATVRADAAFAFHLGMVCICLTPAGVKLPLGRIGQLIASAGSLVAVVGIEHYIKDVVYPYAPYSDSIWQLVRNLHGFNTMAAVVLALPLWGATVWLSAKRWRRLEAWEQGVLLGSLVNFALYVVVGMSDEVRIFLPSAMTVIAVSAPRFYEYLVEELGEAGRPG